MLGETEPYGTVWRTGANETTEIKFYKDVTLGDKKITAGAGELVVLPKMIPHSFNLVTDTAKALLMITPAGFEIVFKEFSTPAQTLDLPPMPGKLPKELFQKLHQRSEELGNIWMPEV